MEPFSISPLVTVSRDWGSVKTKYFMVTCLNLLTQQGAGAQGQGEGLAVKAFTCSL